MSNYTDFSWKPRKITTAVTLQVTNLHHVRRKTYAGLWRKIMTGVHYFKVSFATVKESRIRTETLSGPSLLFLVKKRIKREEDPPWWHLESLHLTALIHQTVGALNMPSLKTRHMWKMSKIIEALCKGEHILKFYHASHLDEIWRRREYCTSNCWIKGGSPPVEAVYLLSNNIHYRHGNFAWRYISRRCCFP